MSGHDDHSGGHRHRVRAITGFLQQPAFANLAFAHRARRQLFIRVFLARVVVLIGVSAALAATGEPTLIVVGLPIVGTILAIPVYRRSIQTRGVPAVMLWLDALALAAAVVTFPRLFIVGVLLLVGHQIFVAAALGTRHCLWLCGVTSTVMAIPALTSRPTFWLAGMILLVAMTISTAVVVGVGFDTGALLKRELDDVLQTLQMVVWRADGTDDDPYAMLGPSGAPNGYTAEFFAQTGSWESLLHPDDVGVAEESRAAIREGRDHIIRYRLRRRDGDYQWYEETIKVQSDSKGRVLGTHGFSRNITNVMHDRLLIEQFADFVEALTVGVLIVREDDLGRGTADRALHIVGANESMRAYFRGDHEELEHIGLDVAIRTGALEVPTASTFLDHVRAIAAGVQPAATVEYETAAGGFWLVRVTPLPGRSAAIVFEDVTARVSAEKELIRQAKTDGLTGLINRVRFGELLAETLGHRFACSIALIDLDRFKDINDNFGHHRGDELLVNVARRIESVRPTGAAVARLGGDEFAVLLPGGSTAADAVAAAHRIAEAFGEPIVLDEYVSLHVSTSIGIAAAPEHGTTADQLLARADVAMYAAKRSGGGHAVYDPSHDTSSARRLVLLGDMQRAMASGELILYYQPILDSDGVMIGVEAVVRWLHPDLGMIMPDDFIELAELSSLSDPLGLTVLRQAVGYARLQHSITAPAAVSINLTARNLSNSSFIEEAARVIEAAGLPAGWLTVEITERSLPADLALPRASITRLKALGVRIAIDDFGSGQTSLALLRALQVDELKIDRTIVNELVDGDDVVVRSVIDLAHQLGLTVVAEGVEHQQTADRLVAFGCDRLQGFLFARPMPADDLARWSRAHDAQRAAR